MTSLSKELTKIINSFLLAKLPEFLAEKEGYPDKTVIESDLLEFLKENMGVKTGKLSQSMMQTWTKRPKRLSGYNMFTREQTPIVTGECMGELEGLSSQEKLAFVSRAIGAKWGELSDEEKREYADQAKQQGSENELREGKKAVNPEMESLRRSKFSATKKDGKYFLVVDGESTRYIVKGPKDLMVCAKLSVNNRQIKLSSKDIEKIKTEYKLKLGNIDNLPAVAKTKSVVKPPTSKASSKKKSIKKEEEREEIDANSDEEIDVNSDEEEPIYSDDEEGIEIETVDEN